MGKSTFVLGDDGEIAKVDNDAAVCWECGKTGHLAWQCPNKKGNSGASNNGGGNGGRARGGGRGGGRGGREGGKSPKRIPPQPGEPHKWTVNGIQMYWCGTCTYWNSTHLTAAHADTKAANVVEGETELAPAEDETEDNRVSFYSTVTQRMAGASK
jgi:hypothetical protein